MTPNSLKTTRERKEKGEKRGEKKKKRTPSTHNFYIAYFGKALTMHQFRHLNRAVSFLKIQVDILNKLF